MDFEFSWTRRLTNQILETVTFQTDIIKECFGHCNTCNKQFKSDSYSNCEEIIKTLDNKCPSCWVKDVKNINDIYCDKNSVVYDILVRAYFYKIIKN